MIQGCKVQLSVYLLQVVGADVILGHSWLTTLGLVVADFGASTLKFYLNGKFNVIQGNIHNTPSQARFHYFRRLVHTNAVAKCYTLLCQHKEISNNQNLELPTEIAPDLVQLLHKYKVVFNKPQGLPPDGAHTHAIPFNARICTCQGQKTL